MSAPTLVVDQAIAVVVGHFNPAIFQPTWLATQGLIASELAADAKLNMIHPSVSSFRAGWLELEVTEQRLRAATSDASCFVLLRDFAAGAMKVLEHTPVRMCGINRAMHFSVSSEEAWHRFGHTLVPKSHWNDLLADPGTRTVAVEGRRASTTAKYTRVTIEPSPREIALHGVKFDFNEHYEQDSDATSAAFAWSILNEQWDAAQLFFNKCSQSLLKLTGDA